MKQAKLTALSALLVSFTGTASALADDSAFGKDGQVILSAERLFGLAHANESDEDGTTHDKTSTSTTEFSLLWPASGAGGSPYTAPRVAIDFVVGGGVTVGGSVGVMTSSGTVTREPVNLPKVDTEAPTSTAFVLQPRVGYALPLSDTFAFWPRAGVTYYSLKVKQTDAFNGAGPTTTLTATQTGFGVDIEAMFVYTPVAHFGITATPLIDIPLSGSQSTTMSPSVVPNPPDDKVKLMTIGAMLGVLGYI